MIENEIPLAQMHAGEELNNIMMTSSGSSIMLTADDLTTTNFGGLKDGEGEGGNGGNGEVEEDSDLGLFSSHSADDLDLERREDGLMGEHEVDLELGGNRLNKNTSGSYSNLFPDESNLGAVKTSSMRTSVSGIGPTMDPDEILAEGGYYSNLPPISLAKTEPMGGMANGQVGDDEIRPIDEDSVAIMMNAHSQNPVYSNIAENINNSNINNLDLDDHHSSFLSSSLNTSSTLDPLTSTMLGDDMDLDDPTNAFDHNKSTYASSQKKQPIKKKSATTNKSAPRVEVKEKHSSHSSTSSTSSDQPLQSQKRTKTHKKHVIPTVAVIETKNNTNNALNSPPSPILQPSVNSPKDASSSSYASRMRLLHDTTMIDTALDLDSLDDAVLSTSSSVQNGIIQATANGKAILLDNGAIV